MARISVPVLAVALAMLAITAQGCWLDGGPCDSNSDCCIGLRCRSGECYWGKINDINIEVLDTLTES